MPTNQPKPPDQDPEDFLANPKTNPAAYPDDPNSLPPGVRNWPIAGAVARKKAEEARAAADKAEAEAKAAEEEATKVADENADVEGEEEALKNPTVNPQPSDKEAKPEPEEEESKSRRHRAKKSEEA